jgi:hypothetical protein
MKAGYMAQCKRKSVSSLTRLSNGQIITSQLSAKFEEQIPVAVSNRKHS